MPLENVRVLGKRGHKTNCTETEISAKRTKQKTRLDQEEMQEILNNIKEEPYEPAVDRDNRLYNECMEDFDDIMTADEIKREKLKQAELREQENEKALMDEDVDTSPGDDPEGGGLYNALFEYFVNFKFISKRN